MMRRDFIAAAVLALASPLALAGCSQPLAARVALEDKTHAPVVDVSAALAGEPDQRLAALFPESCRNGAEQLMAHYTLTHPNITFPDPVFAPTRGLLDAAREGAFDLVTVDLGTTMTALQDEGLVNRALQGSPFGTGLVVAKGHDSQLAVADVAALAGPDVARLVVGDPDAVLSGAAANQALHSADLYTADSGLGGSYAPAVEGKVKVVASLDELAAALAADDRAAALMASSEVLSLPDVEVAAKVMRTSYRSMRYLSAPTGSGVQAAYATDFLDFCMNDDEAKRIEERYGLADV